MVAKHGYGRQLGRMADALEILIAERPAKAPKDKRFLDFLTMKHDIDNVKQAPPPQELRGLLKIWPF